MIKMRLAELMSEADDTVRGLAEVIGCSPNTIQSYTTNKSRIDLEIVEKICAYYGIDVTDFFYTDNTKNPPPGSE